MKPCRGNTARRPASPVTAPISTISAEIAGPRRIFELLMELKPGDDMTHFGYEAREYFVSGTANEQPILGDASAVEF